MVHIFFYQIPKPKSLLMLTNFSLSTRHDQLLHNIRPVTDRGHYFQLDKSIPQCRHLAGRAQVVVTTDAFNEKENGVVNGLFGNVTPSTRRKRGLEVKNGLTNLFWGFCCCCTFSRMVLFLFYFFFSLRFLLLYIFKKGNYQVDNVYFLSSVPNKVMKKLHGF